MLDTKTGQRIKPVLDNNFSITIPSSNQFRLMKMSEKMTENTWQCWKVATNWHFSGNFKTSGNNTYQFQVGILTFLKIKRPNLVLVFHRILDFKTGLNFYSDPFFISNHVFVRGISNQSQRQRVKKDQIPVFCLEVFTIALLTIQTIFSEGRNVLSFKI